MCGKVMRNCGLAEHFLTKEDGLVFNRHSRTKEAVELLLLCIVEWQPACTFSLLLILQSSELR